MNQTTPAATFGVIRLENLVPSITNTRKTFRKEQLEELAETIRQVGVLEPLLVREHPTIQGKYEILAGERRFRAAKKTTLESVDCKLIMADDVQAVEIQAVENLIREQLNPLEEAATYQQLLTATGLTQEALAKRYKKTQSFIGNRLRLLKLPKAWQTKLNNGTAPVTFGRDLAAWVDFPQVFEALRGTVDRMDRALDPGYNWDLADWRACLADALAEVSRPSGDAARLSLTSAETEELQILKMPETMFPKGVERIFNTARLAELLKDWEADHGDDESGPTEAAVQNDLALDDESPVPDQGEEYRPFKNAEGVEAPAIPEKTPEEIQANVDHAQDVADRNKAKAAQAAGNPLYSEYKRDWFQKEIKARLDDPVFLGMVETLVLGMPETWKLDETFLKLHTDAQLMELAQDWGFDMGRLEGYTGQNLIDEILTMDCQLRIQFGDGETHETATAPLGLINAEFPPMTRR